MTTTRLDSLRDELRGAVTLPDEPGYDDARRSFNLSVDQRPAAVAEVTGVEDVQTVLRHAAAAGLRVAPQSTGHGSEPLAPLDGAVLLRTSALREADVDPDARVARVGAGIRAGEAAAAAGAHGLAPLLGFAPTVGVVGLALGGGTGWLSRGHGLTCNSVRGLDVVTADGEARRVDADSEPDLFWALRGGGGRCAIVTALELELQPVPEAYGGLRMWPAERAGEALELFRRLAEELPETTTIVLRYLSLPPFEAIPEPLRGRRVVALLAVHLGGEEEGRRLLAPLEEPGDALVDTFASVGAADLVRVAGDPEEPGPSRGDGLLLEDLPEDLAETLAERMAGDALAPVTVVELRRLGGALGRTPDGHGALASLPAPFSFFAAGIVPDPGVRAAIAEKLAELRSLVGRWASPRTVLNASGGGIDPAAAFEPGVWERLERVRDHYDPDRLILGNHEPA